jgi:transposase
MAHIEYKMVKGRKYYYACRKARVNGKPRNIWQKYLGTAEDIINAYELKSKPEEKACEADIAEFGGVAALLHIANRIKLVDIINHHIPRKSRAVSTGEYLLLASFNRCLAPTSKRKLAAWYAKTSLPRILGFKPGQLTSQRFWDHMDLMSVEKIRAIETELTQHMVHEFNMDLSCLLYDATNFFTFIDTFTEGELAQRGKNKQGRMNLRQIGLALLVTRDFHIPLLHEIYAGNRHDAPEFASVTEMLVDRYKGLSTCCENITLVFDKGNNSKENFEELDQSPFHFVGSLVPTQHPDLLSIPVRKFKEAQDERLSGIKTYRTQKEVFGTVRPIVICHNDNLLEAQLKTIGLVIAKARRKLSDLQRKLKKARKTKTGRKTTLEGIEKQIHCIFSARHLSDLIETRLKKDRWGFFLSYRLNRSALTHLINTLFGKKILFTDQNEWTDEQIVLAYHGQAGIEEAFKRMKDPHFLCWYPQNHWTDQKIQVHGFYCVLALTLASLMQRELALKGIHISIPRGLGLLKGIREVALIYPERKRRGRKPKRIAEQIEEKHRRDRIILSKMTPEQKMLFDLLGLARYQPVNATSVKL